MRLRRAKPPPVRPEHARYLFEVALALRDSLRMHASLPVDRDALLAQAREGAIQVRLARVFGHGLVTEIPEQLSPLPALAVLERATCSLVAHAQSPPDPTGALRPGEIDELVDDDLRKWLRFCLQPAADGEPE
jgi:hypothetical protein